MTISASLTASALTVAPAAVNSESGSQDLMPAPGSTTTSTPSALNFFTVSGEAATRGSDGSISSLREGPHPAERFRAWELLQLRVSQRLALTDRTRCVPRRPSPNGSSDNALAELVVQR
jgi:hypothetical protein